MKKIALIILLAFTIVSCTNTENNTNIEVTTEENAKVEVTTEENKGDAVKATDTIIVTYTGSLEDGTVFDSSSKHPGQDLSFVVGQWKVIVWFDNWVIGMKLWETKTINIEAKDAYGESNELLLADADFEAIGKAGLKKEDIVLWMNIIWEVWEIEILRIDWDKYYARHPSELAWKNLIFEVRIDKITPFVLKEIVSNGDQISVTYTGELEDGTVFDTNNKEWAAPLEFIAGAWQMIAGFDAGVIGMKLGETKRLEIEAKDAYGETGTHELAWKDLIFEVTIESIR